MASASYLTSKMLTRASARRNSWHSKSVLRSMPAGSGERASSDIAFNRHGEAFDQGETFSGVPLDVAFAALEELKPLVPAGVSFAQFALRWILQFEAVTCVIPGAKRPDQLDDNVAASDLSALPPSTMQKAQSIYDRLIKPLVHQRW